MYMLDGSGISRDMARGSGVAPAAWLALANAGGGVTGGRHD